MRVVGFKPSICAGLLLCALALAFGAACAQPPDRTAGLKYHPGHYIALNRSDDRAVFDQVARPGVRGVQVRYTWAELEPERGQYDFTRLKSDLEAARALELRLVALLEDKTFTTEQPTPAYLLDLTLAHTNADGWIAKRWDAEVVERYARLLEALGAEFDGLEAFEGVAIQESAISMPAELREQHGYTPEGYRDALIDMLLAARRAFPSSQVFWYMNFLPGNQAYIADIARRVAAHRIAMGGPDVLPDDAALSRMTYPFYKQFADSMTLFASMQFNSYAHRRAAPTADSRYWTMEELFLFARDELHADYIFWNRKDWRSPPDSWDWTDALTVIRTWPRFAQ